MDRSFRCSLSAVSIGLAVVFSSLPADAQMYPQDIHSQSRGRGVTVPSQSAFGGIGALDLASEFFQRRQEEEQERRDMLERQRRMMENYTNIPDQLREPYFRRADRPGPLDRSLGMR
jgi:hypothetical protein